MAGLNGAGAAGAFFATVWAGEVTLLPALNVAPPLTQWGVEEIAIDALHHAIYAAVTSVAFELIESNS